MTILYTTDDNSINVKLTFNQASRMIITHAGKSLPKHTQCLLYVNGVLEHFSTIRKHYKDEDNQNEAFHISAVQAAMQLKPLWLRDAVLNKIISTFRK